MSKGEDMDIVSEDGARANAQAVMTALRQRGWDAACLGVDGDVSGCITQLLGLNPDVVFNLAETVMGESSLESFVPGLMEFLGFPYTGCDPAAINLCLDKSRTKEILIACGIPTPPYQVMADANAVLCNLDFPLIVKPLREDGSLGIHERSVAHNASGLAEQIKFILKHYHQPALVESYVGEREFNVSILGNGSPVILPICEIDYSRMPEGLPKIVGFKAKWFPESPEYQGSMPVCPAPIEGALREQVEHIALAAYEACGLRDYGRIDLRWDGQHQPMVIDVNPNPAISRDAGFVLSAQKAGLSYEDLLERIVQLALERSVRAAA